MAYDTKELEQQAIKAIREHDLFFIEDVVAYLPCSKPTFYEHKLNEVDELKGLLIENRIKKKVAMRKKWFDSDNATLQMALMKLIAFDDERRRLAMEYRDHTSKGESLNKPDLSNLSTEDKKQLAEILARAS